MRKVYFVSLGINFDYTLNVKVVTAHALILFQSLYTPDGGKGLKGIFACCDYIAHVE